MILCSIQSNERLWIVDFHTVPTLKWERLWCFFRTELVPESLWVY